MASVALWETAGLSEQIFSRNQQIISCCRRLGRQMHLVKRSMKGGCAWSDRLTQHVREAHTPPANFQYETPAQHDYMKNICRSNHLCDEVNT